MCLQNHRTKLSGTQRQPDAVLEVIRYDEFFMFNPEFQSAYDRGMAERSLLYHVKEIRKKLHMTQEQFALRFHLPLGTLRDWEQGAKQPDTAARSYLRVIEKAPQTVMQALEG
jgi:putative transcriptional regulator